MFGLFKKDKTKRLNEAYGAALLAARDPPRRTSPAGKSDNLPVEVDRK